ncbi:hypothetical protein BaRGS_00023273, partial [Batillaria attramentaria]
TYSICAVFVSFLRPSRDTDGDVNQVPACWVSVTEHDEYNQQRENVFHRLCAFGCCEVICLLAVGLVHE